MTSRTIFQALLLLLFTFTATAQNKEEIKEMFWGANDSQKANVAVPEKWKNESAVILYKEYFYDYHKFYKKVKYSYSLRKRIMLQDQAAIKEHSEFAFSKKFKVNRGVGWRRTAINHIGVRIIKADGTSREIPVDEEAVKTDEEFKLAISGLEIGDILDYYIYTIEPFNQDLGYEFEPKTKILNDEYPIVEMVMRFNTENDFFINFNSYNGAPKLQKVPTDTRNDRRYILRAENVEKRDFPTWYYPQNELPYYKFQVIFARKGSHEDDIFNYLSEDEAIIKKQVTQEEVRKLYQKNRRHSSRASGLDEYLKNKELSDKEKIIEAYYFLRHHYLTQFVERSVFVESKIIPGHTVNNASEDYFVAMDNTTLMASFLLRNEIPYNLIIAIPRYAGKINDLLYRTEATEFIEVPFESGSLYLPPLNLHSEVNTIDYFFENTNAYALKYQAKKEKERAMEVKKIRGTSYKDNGSKTTQTININEGFDKMAINKTTNTFGHNKGSAQEDALMYFDYVEEDHKKYDNPTFIEAGIKRQKNQERVRSEALALKNKLKTKQKDYLKKQLEAEFEFEVENYLVTIQNTGRHGRDSQFILEETFLAPDSFIKKAGSNYLFEIGRFIGGQISLDEEEKLRSNNIYMPFPRSFENTIELTIPAGYTVEGLNELNAKVENETGGFRSTATIVDNILKVHTFKYYKNYYEPNANWPKMVDFLDAAYEFTQQKVMLKKTAVNGK